MTACCEKSLRTRLLSAIAAGQIRRAGPHFVMDGEIVDELVQRLWEDGLIGPTQYGPLRLTIRGWRVLRGGSGE